MSAQRHILPPSLPPRGLCRIEAAQYVGVSVGKWDDMVREGLMPSAKRIGGRKVWDRLAVDLAFAALPDDDDGRANPWDAVA